MSCSDGDGIDDIWGLGSGSDKGADDPDYDSLSSSGEIICEFCEVSSKTIDAIAKSKDPKTKKKTDWAKSTKRKLITRSGRKVRKTSVWWQLPCVLQYLEKALGAGQVPKGEENMVQKRP